MNYKIISTENFEKRAKKLLKKYPSLLNELIELKEKLQTNAEIGTAIGKNCYKIRIKIASKEKGNQEEQEL